MERVTKLGVTATRGGLTQPQLLSVRYLLWRPGADEVGELHHGDCVGGDASVHELAKLYGWRVVIHPPTDPKHRAWCEGDELWPEKEYLVRNHDIVVVTQALVALPGQAHEVLRSGTWATVRYARKMGRPVILVPPNGRIERQEAA